MQTNCDLNGLLLLLASTLCLTFVPASADGQTVLQDSAAQDSAAQDSAAQDSAAQDSTGEDSTGEGSAGGDATSGNTALESYTGRASAGQDTTTTTSRLKDPGRAVWYSVGATVLLAPAFGAGIIVGPAAGHFYARDFGQAWKGIGIRAGAAAAPIVLSRAATLGGDDAAAEGWRGLGVFLYSGIVAIGVIAYSAIFDIATADNSARDYNRSLGPRGTSLRVAPTVRGPEGEQIGLALRLQF